MSSSNVPVKVFIADDSSLMLGASVMPIVGPTPQDLIDGTLTVFPSVAVLDVQLYGGSGLQVLRAVRHVAPNINFLVFNNSSDSGHGKCYLSVGTEDFSDKTANLTSLHMLLSKFRSKSPINPT